jgi:BolA protein
MLDESHLDAGHFGAKSGGGHFRAVIVSKKFAGLSRVKAQQLAHGAMGAWMGKEIHALSMQMFAPAEWRGRS